LLLLLLEESPCSIGESLCQYRAETPALQLPVGRPDDLAITVQLHIRRCNLAACALVIQCLQALGQDRVAVVVRCIQPISIHGRQVLDLQLDQRPGQLLLVSQVEGELVGLELEFATEDVHQESNERVHGGKRFREQDESDHDRVLMVEAEGVVETVVVDEDTEEGKDVEEVQLSNTEELGGVRERPVAKFVAQDRFDFLWLTLLHQGVVDDNVLLPR